jgi:translation initiation factor IF-3
MVNKVFANNTGNNNKEKSSNDGLNKYLVNHQIRADRMMVIDHQGQSLGVVLRSQALARAEEVGMDLVQVGEKDGMPITKLMDYGKFLYMKKKQLGDAKKHQKVIHVKEIKMRPNIGDQDYKTKINQAAQFFLEGDKVKFTLQFRGREATMLEDLGPKLFARIGRDLAERNVGALVEEKDSRSGVLWSKIFYVKGK